MKRLILLLCVSACGGVEILGETDSHSHDSHDSSDEHGVPDDVVAAFEDVCSTSGCHSGSTPAQGLSLEEKHLVDIRDQEAVQQPMDLIVLGDPWDSYIYVKVHPNPPIGQQMPPGQPNLIEVAIIRQWIESI